MTDHNALPSEKKKKKVLPALLQGLASLFRKLSQGCSSSFSSPDSALRPLSVGGKRERAAEKNEKGGRPKPKGGQDASLGLSSGSGGKGRGPCLASISTYLRPFFLFSSFLFCFTCFTCFLYTQQPTPSNVKLHFHFPHCSHILFFHCIHTSLSPFFRLTTTATTSKTSHTYSNNNDSTLIPSYSNNNDQQHETTSIYKHKVQYPNHAFVTAPSSQLPTPSSLFFSSSPVSFSLSLFPSLPPPPYYSFFFSPTLVVFVTKWAKGKNTKSKKREGRKGSVHHFPTSFSPQRKHWGICRGYRETSFLVCCFTCASYGHGVRLNAYFFCINRQWTNGSSCLGSGICSTQFLHTSTLITNTHPRSLLFNHSNENSKTSRIILFLFFHFSIFHASLWSFFAPTSTNQLFRHPPQQPMGKPFILIMQR